MDGIACTASPGRVDDADTARRIAQPSLHPGQGHYARNVKIGAKAAMPVVSKSSSSLPSATDADAALPSAVPVKKTSNTKEANGKVDTLKIPVACLQASGLRCHGSRAK